MKSPEFEHISHVKCIDLKIHPGTQENKDTTIEMNSILLLSNTNNFKGIFIRADVDYRATGWIFIYNQL